MFSSPGFAAGLAAKAGSDDTVARVLYDAEHPDRRA